MRPAYISTAAWLSLCFCLLLLPPAALANAAPTQASTGKVCSLPFAVNNRLRDLPLTPGSIRVGCPTDFPPYSFLDEQGRLAGVYPDLITALNLRLNGLLRATPVSGAEYPSRALLMHWSLDAFMGPAEELPANALLSLPLFRSSAVWLGRDQHGARQLRKNPLRVIALPHTPDLAALKSQYPNMSFTWRNGRDAAVAAMRAGEGGLIIGDELAVHSEKRALPPGFAILGSLGSHYHSIGVRPDLEQLLPLLDSALISLPPQERRAIMEAWRGETKSYSLTPEEQAWLAQRPVVRVAVPTWAPYSNFSGEHGFIGMAASCLQELGNRLGIAFQPVPVADGRDALEAVLRGKAEMTAVTPVNARHEPGVLYTQSWLSAPVAIAARSDSGLSRLEKLSGKTLAVIARGLPERWIAARQPGVKLLPVEDCPQALKAVSANRAQAAVDALDTLSHYIRRDHLKQISITGFTPLTLELGFAVRADQPRLAALLDKGLAALPPETMRRIYLQWSQAVEVPFMDWGLFRRYALIALLCMLAIVGIFATVNRRLRREIRDRQKAEGILHQIFSHMPAALILCDAGLRCIAANRHSLETFGLDAARLNGKTFQEAALAEDLPASAAKTLGRLEQTARSAFERHICITLKHVNEPGGQAAYFKTWCMPLFDKSGDPDCLIVLSVDISPSMRLEKELRRQLEFSKGILDSLPLPVWVYDTDSRYMLVNKAYEELIGGPGQELLGKTVLDTPLLAPELRARFKNGLDALFASGGVLHEEISFSPAEGPERTGLAWLSAFAVSPGEPPRVAGALVDITDRKHLEEELRRALRAADKASQAKSDFLTHMSHELRTPMNGILGLCDLLLRDELSGRQRDFLEKIHFSAKLLVRLIGDILDFSRMEAGALRLADSAFDLREVLDSVRAALAANCRAKGLDFRISVRPGTPLRLNGDAARLSQVLLNLAANAVKFTEHGGVRIDVCAARLEGRDALLRFAVCDSGMGIDYDAALHVFKPFTQADSGMDRRHGGAGLGLSIAQKLVEAMRGEINCESEPGKGSAFYFTARFSLAEPPAGEQPPGSLPPAPRPGGEPKSEDFPSPALAGKRLLLVEDNPVNQLVAEELLTAFGALVDTADDGLQGVEKARRQHYDCILMDIQMPRMDGLTAARLLKGDPACAATPIIALTAHALDEDRRKSREAGMAAHLIKPLDPAELRAVLERVLSARA